MLNYTQSLHNITRNTTFWCGLQWRKTFTNKSWTITPKII